MNTSPHEKTDEFLSLFRACERRLFAYLMAMLGNPTDAEDVLQETLLVLWQNFGDFEQGTNFYAWAKQTAYHRLLIHRRTKRRQGVVWDEPVFEAVESVCSQQEGRLTDYLQYLDGCVAKLSDSDRTLLQTRFQRDRTIKSVAEQLQRPADTVYKALTRIYRWLAQCVERTASAEDRQ